MGAFILIRNNKDWAPAYYESLYNASQQVFRKKGLSLNQSITTPDFILYTYYKSKLKIENTLIMEDGQFIAATGTLIYNRKTGQKALRELFQDFSIRGDFMVKTLGQFALIVFKQGKLYICNDYTGLYHIFTNEQKNIISSSFLAILKTLNRITVSPQELYEYVIGGSAFGGKTPVKEIELLDHKGLIQLSPEIKKMPSLPAAPPFVKRFEVATSPEKTSRTIAEDLIEYFRILKANYGDSVCSALTGGIHTRLMLGLMKKAEIKPAYLYQFGNPHNLTGRDANAYPIAKSIAEAEGLKLDFIDTTQANKIALDSYREYVEHSYYLGDGLGHEVGIFHSSFNPGLRCDRAEKAHLILNGAGGEAFRNYWVLPDHPFHIDSFIKSRYDNMDSSIFTSHFDRNSYFSGFKEKILKSLGTESEYLNRRQIELVQPDFENRYWMGNNNSINNQLSCYLTPFGDTQIVYRACDVPLKMKDWSQWESALMRAIDPDLAKYPTAQGIDLKNNRFKFKVRINQAARQHIPIWLKAYLRKHYYSGAEEHLKWSGNRMPLPYYLTREYLETILPLKELSVTEYFRIDSIDNPAVLSRALTADLVINNRL